jgi:fermentation-respiration switch protein FrsA (DUF1100 family)
MAAHALLVVALLLAALVAFRAYARERMAMAPSRHSVPLPDALCRAGLGAVSFTVPGAGTIRGWYRPPPGGAVVILTHGSGADRSQLAPHASTLADRGLGVLLFDWPGHGESDGAPSYGEPGRATLRAALYWLASKNDVGRIGAFGFSLGAWVVAQVAPLDARVRAMAVEGLPTDLVAQTRHEYRRWGPLSQWPALLALRGTGARMGPLPAETLPRLAPRPLLIVHGAEDPSVPVAMAEELYRAAARPKEIWIVPGAGHGDVWRVAGREYARRLGEFFEAALAGGPSATGGEPGVEPACADESVG